MDGAGTETGAGPSQRGRRARVPVVALAGLAAVALLVLLLAVSAPARARADDFLQTFRTSRHGQLAIVDLNIQVPGLDPQAADDVVDIQLPEGREVPAAHAAQDSVDFNVRSLRRQQAPRVYVVLGQTATITVNRGALERALAGLGVPGLRLPAEFDTPLQAQLTAAVRQVWQDPSGPITLWIARNPRLYTTQGPSWEELRDRLQQIASVLAPESAREIAQVQDWDNTVLVPVPPGATARRVRADATDDALLIERGGRSTLVWQRYGVVHVLDAQMPGAAVVQLASSLR